MTKTVQNPRRKRTVPVARRSTPARPTKEDVDDLDRAIIGRLQLDGRATVRSIARALNASEVTVRRRIGGLVRSKVIQILPIVNPDVFGYEIVAELGLEVETGKVREVARQLAAFDQVFFVAVTTGKFDVVCWIVLSTRHDLLVF